MKYQHFRFDIAWLCLRQGNRSTTTMWIHEAFKGARGHKKSLSVVFGAPSLDPIFRLISGCSKYVTFSITFGPPVLQTTVYVAFGARCRAAPARLLGGALAIPAAPTGQDVRQVRAPSAFAAPRSLQSAPARTHVARVVPKRSKEPSTRPHHKHLQTS